MATYRCLYAKKPKIKPRKTVSSILFHYYFQGKSQIFIFNKSDIDLSISMMKRKKNIFNISDLDTFNINDEKKENLF